MAFLSAQSPPAMTELHKWVLDSPVQLRSLRASLHEAITGQPLPVGAELEMPNLLAWISSQSAAKSA